MKTKINYIPARISFEFCINKFKTPISSSISEIIVNEKSYNEYINKAVKIFENNLMNSAIKAKIPISCSDINNFLDCKEVGKIMGVTFAYKVECDLDYN